MGILASAERNDRRLFESLNEGVWERDLRTGEVWYSPRYKQMLGFTDDELPNRLEAIRSRIHPDDLPALVEAYARAERDLADAHNQSRLKTKDGSWRWFRGRVRVWPDAEGRAAVLVGALYDVHEQILATEALKAQQTILEERVRERTKGLEAALEQAEAQRLAAERANQAKAMFLAHMSHELRTPLNGVLGMNQLAQPLAIAPEQRRYLELAHQSGQTLLRILDDVLDFARVEAGRLQLSIESFDLSQLAVETLRSFMPDVRQKGLRVGFDYVGDLSCVYGDAGRMRQILSNLIGNAIKFTERGHILLIVVVTPAEEGFCQVRLRMRDTGIGMDEATTARVFEPFEQGDLALNRQHGGTGLGLSLVRLLASLMDGDVSVRSRPGLGSEFRVELRLGTSAEQPLRNLAVERSRPNHVWLVTRSASVGLGLRQRLERMGWTGERLNDVDSAVAALKEGTGEHPPDCVLMSEDALTTHTDFASLRRHLPAGVPVTLLLRPDFDVRTVHTAAEQWQVKVAIAPLGPADLYSLAQSVADDAAGARPAVRALSPASPSSRPNVLVVEDNLMNQIIAREMVAALGLQPAVVGSGEEAVVSCQCTPPDLVLMDVQMPGMDGLEATRRLRALQASGHLRRFPIIALTAHAMASDRQASLDAGMDAHLTKPVQLEQLRSVLDHWLRQPTPP